MGKLKDTTFGNRNLKYQDYDDDFLDDDYHYQQFLKQRQLKKNNLPGVITIMTLQMKVIMESFIIGTQ